MLTEEGELDWELVEEEQWGRQSQAEAEGGLSQAGESGRARNSSSS